jgi:hypothetical protein
LRFRRWIWLLPGAVPLAQQLNVLLLNPSQDARYMFGAYMVAVSTLPLLWLLRRSVPVPAVDEPITADDVSPDVAHAREETGDELVTES